MNASLLLAAAAGVLGVWQPTSRALEPLGPLRLETAAVDWSICRGAIPRALPEAGTYALEGTPGCLLDGRPISHLRLTARPGNCRAELSLFGSEAELRAGQPEAWGLVQRPGCR